MFGSVWDEFGIVFGSLWDEFGIMLGSVWDEFGVIFGYFPSMFLPLGLNNDFKMTGKISMIKFLTQGAKPPGDSSRN